MPIAQAVGRVGARVGAAVFALGVVLGLLQPIAAHAAVTWPAGDDQTVLDGQQLPWDLVQISDGSLLFTTSDSGNISHVTGAGQTRVVGTVPDIQPLNEGGLLGLVQDPRDPRAFFAYASSTVPGGNRNRVWRLTWDGLTMRPDRVILGDIPHGRIHSGGRLAFGPDGYLYVTTGDVDDRSTSQHLGSLAGKLLRVDREGRAAPGNPFATRTGADARVWSYGHRNVQGLAWDSSGRMWASEFGNDAADELNRIEPGRNYGWPVCEGPRRYGSQTACNDSGLTNPAHHWRPFDASPSGIAIVGDTLYMATLRGQSLWAIPLSGGQPVRHLQGAYGRLRSVVPSSDDRLFIMTSNGASNDRIVLVTQRPTTNPIQTRYDELGGAATLGASLGGPWCELRNDGCFARYERGSIYWSPASGAQPIRGAIRDKWGQMGWENGRLGYPTSREHCGLKDNGCLQRFQGGMIYWTPRTEAYAVWGAISERWAAQRWEQGQLGYPVSDEFCGLRDRGCFQRFQAGSIYWSPGSGAHPVRGGLRDLWGQYGWENGSWGYPLEAETCVPGHCSQRFQGGTLHLRW